MSTASEDSSSDPPQRTSHPPGALAIFAATAIGGVLATRMGKTPLIFAAGAAALALLQKKKPAAPPRAEPLKLPPPAPPQLEIPEPRVLPAALPLEIPVESLPPPALPALETPVLFVPPAAPQVELPLPNVLRPAPEVDTSAQSLVEQWLARQISREAEAPVVDFSTLTATAREPEDDYRPGSFLLEDGDDMAGAAPADIDSFASLTEPATQSIWVPEPLIVDEEPVFDEVEPQVAAAEALFAELEPMNADAVEEPGYPAAPSAADAAWKLGMEPMPSLNDAAPQVAPAGSMSFSPGVPQEDTSSEPEATHSNMFSTAPVQQEEVAAPLFFATSVFQGAAFPDEIQVAPPFEPVPPMPAPPAAEEAPAWAAEEPVGEAAPAAETAPEIPLELAADGEASFDEPLAAAPTNPWQPEPDGFPMTPPVTDHTQMAGTVVEAEIILRPRAPTQNAVIARAKFSPSSFNNHFADASNDTTPAEDAHFPGPLQSKRQPKPQTTWRSWWRGD